MGDSNYLRTCVRCQKQFIGTKTSKYCYVCKAEDNGLRCEICGKALVGKQTKVCSRKCRNESNKAPVDAKPKKEKPIVEKSAVELEREAREHHMDYGNWVALHNKPKWERKWG